ncbi:MAG: T9SS type A sorting domain-containing protein [Saprospiraceae bacterium]|nr:T9SS type A sorting domain-containing protein [Candidatus Vicinibacter affinis]
MTIEQFENLDYDIKWNCGDTIRNVTTTKDLIKINPKFKNNSIWKNLNCYPIPVKDLLTCKEIENDIPLVLHIYDLRGKRYLIPYTFKSSNILINMSNLTPGIYILNVIGKKGDYRAKVLVE